MQGTLLLASLVLLVALPTTARAGAPGAALIADLGLPGRLRDVGVKEEQLDAIAEHSMHDRWVHTNPRKIDGPATVRMLLDAAW